MKVCRVCKEEKELDLFHKNNQTKDSIANVCIECKKIYMLQREQEKYLQKNTGKFYYKKCKVHGPLNPEDILIMQRMDRGKFQITLRCIPCRISWEEKSLFNKHLSQERLDKNLPILCKRCGVYSLPDNFIISELTKKTPECKTCWKKTAIDYENRVSISRKFKLTRPEYNVLWQKQNGLCAICNKPETIIDRGKVRNLAADHCHKHQKETGVTKIRGLLCTHCNNGLGRFKDSPELLRLAADYLESQN